MINYTPGPSQLYFTVDDHVKKAFRDGIPSLSHRSKQFERLFLEATNDLRNLLSIPHDYSVFFTGSATEIWERSIQNLTEQVSFHAINGAFSQRYGEVARQLGRKSVDLIIPDGQGFGHVNIPDGCELIALTHNETSTGAVLPINTIKVVQDQNPKALIIVDATSSLPYPAFDYSCLDSVFFSVQKGFGLPSGLGVWIVNRRCLDKADNLLSKGVSIGSYHSLLSLKAYADKNQTPETPNVLGIYLLGKVIRDFLVRGISTIRKETEYKSAVLYKALDQHPFISPFVKDINHRSKTVIVASCGARTTEVSAYLQSEGILAGEGYGKYNQTHLRFANFPAHSREQYEKLADMLETFR